MKVVKPSRGPIFRLPPFTIQTLLAPELLSEVVDWSLAAYNIPTQWKQTQGAGVKVAVLDTGIDATHPDLAAAIDSLQDFTGSPFGTLDRVGHGTHTAGTIAARQNGRGVVGVAPQCRLLVGKVLGDDGSGDDAQVAEGIAWAVESGADLISMSLGSPVPGPAIEQALEAAVAAGKFVICAAGNDGHGAGDDGANDEVDYPGRWPGAIAVAAVDETGQVADFSSRGAEVCIAAPGVNILSTFPGGGYARLSGTSMATPFVSGVVALKLAERKAQAGSTLPSPVELRSELTQTATAAGGSNPNNEYGWGLVNPAALLTTAPSPAPAPTGTPSIDLKFPSTLVFGGQTLSGVFVFQSGS